ncbi:MAG: hypothetical protein ABDH91_05115 [Bacteroidia bacterium]
MWRTLLWSSGLVVGWGQLPARYVLKADIFSFLWREQRLSGEYRLFEYAPPFVAGVERPKWEGLTAIGSVAFFRHLPLYGILLRPGLRYYPLRPVYSPQGFWSGLHLAGGLFFLREGPLRAAGGLGLSVGYQYIFRQAYGATVEPFLQGEIIFPSFSLSPLQVGLQVGFAGRKWWGQNLP